MSRLYWRFVARFTFIVRYGWREYKELNELVKSPGQDKRGVDFWGIRPGSKLERYFKFSDKYKFDESSSGIVNAWPYKFDGNDGLGPDWLLPILVEGRITGCPLADMGILPYYPQHWNRAYSAIVGHDRPNLDAPFDEFSPFTPAPYQAFQPLGWLVGIKGAFGPLPLDECFDFKILGLTANSVAIACTMALHFYLGKAIIYTWYYDNMKTVLFLPGFKEGVDSKYYTRTLKAIESKATGLNLCQSTGRAQLSMTGLARLAKCMASMIRLILFWLGFHMAH